MCSMCMYVAICSSYLFRHLRTQHVSGVSGCPCDSPRSCSPPRQSCWPLHCHKIPTPHFPSTRNHLGGLSLRLLLLLISFYRRPKQTCLASSIYSCFTNLGYQVRFQGTKTKWSPKVTLFAKPWISKLWLRFFAVGFGQGSQQKHAVLHRAMIHPAATSRWNKLVGTKVVGQEIPCQKMPNRSHCTWFIYIYIIIIRCILYVI